MTIQEKVAAVAAKFTAVEYRFMNWAQLNVELDHITKPTICYLLPAAGTLAPSRSASLWVDAPQTQIAFLMPTDLDSVGSENDDKVEQMKTLAKLFVRALNKSGYFAMIDGGYLEYQVPYDIMDDNLTGIILTLTLQEAVGTTLCSAANNAFGYTEQ